MIFKQPECAGSHDEGKDCELLDSSLSPHRTDSILERIARIRRELKKGEAVYTQAELQHLQAMLEEYLFILDRLQEG